MQTGILTHASTRPLVRSRSLQIAMWVSAFTIATALSAQVRIPLPFTPVPLTLQTFFVLLAGVVLGPGWGALSQGLYLAIGAAGLPVFQGGGAGLTCLSGITAGYLLSFPVAAYLAGMVIGSSLKRLRVYSALLVSGLFILAAGTAWLAFLRGTSLWQEAQFGFWPFIAGDLIKTAAAAELGLRIGRRS